MGKGAIIFILIIVIIILLGIIFIRIYEKNINDGCHDYVNLRYEKSLCLGLLNKISQYEESTFQGRNCSIEKTGYECLGIKIPISVVESE
jgi:hypothetical protein